VAVVQVDHLARDPVELVAAAQEIDRVELVTLGPPRSPRPAVDAPGHW